MIKSLFSTAIRIAFVRSAPIVHSATLFRLEENPAISFFTYFRLEFEYLDGDRRFSPDEQAPGSFSSIALGRFATSFFDTLPAAPEAPTVADGGGGL